MTPPQIESALSHAQVICKMRGARLTPVRRRVLELILSSDKPTGAYALLAELRRGRGKLGPPTVYRALEFLLPNKLTHKVEPPDPEVLFPFEKEALSDGRLAR